MSETNLTTELKTEPNIGNRIGAGIIDYLIICIFFIIYVYTFGEPNDEGGYSVNGLPALIPVLFWGIMTVGIEQWFGATLGNFLVGLKPVSIQKSSENSTFRGTNEKLTFGQSLKRHLLDPVDMFFFGLIGIVTIKNTDKNQRLGDIWGNTIVVKTPKFNKTE
ncbi:RDD family protein [Bizionia sp. KMM 8389]